MRVKDAVGRFGEDVACRHLTTHGFEVLTRNWRCPEGELDIIARERDELVIVEVKTRSSSQFGSPAEAVGRAKAARLRRLAARWLEEHRQAGGAPWAGVRIDVIAVVRSARGPVQIEHIVGAV